jgi:dTDP-4-amino-4,6-dideoxygalactose transaminase
MSIPLVDLDAIHGPIRDAMLEAIARVVASNTFIQGPEVEALERELAETLGVPEVIGCSSGTDALLMAMMALGIGPGDEVVTTPYTFVSTANTVLRLGAKPVFVDIEPRSMNLAVDQLEAAVTPATRAVIPVHLFGRPADMGGVLAVAARHRLAVIEDAAQAILASLDGRQVGAHGTLGCFSFFPAKNLGALGDGGAVTTGDAGLAKQLRAIRTHGGLRRYHHDLLGGNFRLDALQAAVLRVKLRSLEGWTRAREEAAARYRELFASVAPAPEVTLPEPGPGRHVWNQFVIRVPEGRRDSVTSALSAAGIGWAIYYPIPLHLQPCFEHLGHRPGSFPESERAARETLAIPVAPGTRPDQQARVVQVIAQGLGGKP